MWCVEQRREGRVSRRKLTIWHRCLVHLQSTNGTERDTDTRVTVYAMGGVDVCVHSAPALCRRIRALAQWYPSCRMPTRLHITYTHPSIQRLSLCVCVCVCVCVMGSVRHTVGAVVRLVELVIVEIIILHTQTPQHKTHIHTCLSVCLSASVSPSQIGWSPTSCLLPSSPLFSAVDRLVSSAHTNSTSAHTHTHTHTHGSSPYLCVCVCVCGMGSVRFFATGLLSIFFFILVAVLVLLGVVMHEEWVKGGMVGGSGKRSTHSPSNAYTDKGIVCTHTQRERSNHRFVWVEVGEEGRAYLWERVVVVCRHGCVCVHPSAAAHLVHLVVELQVDRQRSRQQTGSRTDTHNTPPRNVSLSFSLSVCVGGGEEVWFTHMGVGAFESMKCSMASGYEWWLCAGGSGCGCGCGCP